MPPRAIETKYKGYRFRSRLEARWAVFFDALGLQWEYEPEGFELPSGRYLPDFFIRWSATKSARLLQFREVGYWVEIKGPEPTKDEIQRLAELTTATGHIGYLLHGTPSSFRCWVSNNKGEVREWENPHLTADWLAFVTCCPAAYPSPAKVAKAVEVSRGARFEFGESGGVK